MVAPIVVTGMESRMGLLDLLNVEYPMARVTDPVCGMVLESSEAAATSTLNGKTYYFCSAECKEEFDANPTEFEDIADGGIAEEIIRPDELQDEASDAAHDLTTMIEQNAQRHMRGGV